MALRTDTLGDRLTLIWHNHFATARSKVEDLGLMRRQNETSRRLARARFGTLLGASIREPALLLYLDAPSNRKDHPNENLARELMELFTLGIGHYTEADVREAARESAIRVHPELPCGPVECDDSDDRPAWFAALRTRRWCDFPVHVVRAGSRPA